MKKYQNIFMLSAMFLSAQVAHSQRAIAFEGIENARDMGGLVMQDVSERGMTVLVSSHKSAHFLKHKKLLIRFISI